MIGDECVANHTTAFNFHILMLAEITEKQIAAEEKTGNEGNKQKIAADKNKRWATQTQEHQVMAPIILEEISR